MLRWCRSSYRVSPGYGARNAHFIRTRSEAVDASEATSAGSTNSIRTQPVATAVAGRDAVHAKHNVIPTLYYYDNPLSEECLRQQTWSLSLLQGQDSLAHSPSSTLATPTTTQRSLLDASSNSQSTTFYNNTLSRLAIPARKPIDPPRRTSASLLPSSHRTGKLGDPVAISQLTWYLQPCGLRTTIFSGSVLDQLVVLYRSCRSSGSLGGMSKEDFETLITLFGLHSTSSPLPSIIQQQANVSKGTAGERKVYWGFVLEVAEDRCKILRGSMTEVERFWRFQGLANLLTEKRNVSKRASPVFSSTKPDSTSTKEQTRDAPKLITEDYQVLRRTVGEESFHLAYFRTVSASATTFDIPQALGYLCDYLESHNQPSQAFVQLMCQFLLQHGKGLPPSIQNRVLAIDPGTGASTSPPSGSPQIITSQKGNPRGERSPGLLCTLFATVLFRGFHPNMTTPALLAWANEETIAACGPHQPLSDRWDNLLLLFSAVVPDGGSPSRFVYSTVTPGSKWRTLLLISRLGNAFGCVDLSDATGPSTILQLSAKADSLWKAWIQAGSAAPVEIERTVLSTLFETVFVTGNVTALEEYARYCITHNLACFSEDDPPPVRQQIAYLLATYIHAKGYCKGYYWEHLLRDATRLLPEGAHLQNEEVLSTLLPLLLPHELDDAYSLSQFTSSKGIRLAPNAVLPLATMLAERQRWSIVIPLLSNGQFSDRQAEIILVSALRTFQTSRLEVINARLAENLGRVAHRLYSTIQPSPSSKFPVRYFFRLLITAGHGELAVPIINNIIAQDPSFFTQRCVRRWLVQLVQRQSPRHAMDLFKISEPHFTRPQVEDMRRKLLSALVDSGDTSIARQLTNQTSHPPPRSAAPFEQTTREKLLRLVLRSSTAEEPPSHGSKKKAKNHFPARTTRISSRHTRRQPVSHPASKSHFKTLQVMSIINADHRPSSASIRTAISILVRHGRFYAARKLLDRTKLASVDRRELTTMGNIILHGWLHLHQAKKLGGLRMVFRLAERLQEECGLEPDRTTINILTKAILANESRENPDGLRPLFDLFMERGYPASERWKDPSGGLFTRTPDEAAGPPATSTWAERLPFGAVDEQPISILKHVQPLYKMFIKHFYLVGDLEAAQMIVGILKEEQHVDLERREAESRARRMGVVRKKGRQG